MLYDDFCNNSFSIKIDHLQYVAIVLLLNYVQQEQQKSINLQLSAEPAYWLYYRHSLQLQIILTLRIVDYCIASFFVFIRLENCMNFMQGKFS